MHQLYWLADCHMTAAVWLVNVTWHQLYWLADCTWSVLDLHCTIIFFFFENLFFMKFSWVDYSWIGDSHGHAWFRSDVYSRAYFSCILINSEISEMKFNTIIVYSYLLVLLYCTQPHVYKTHQHQLSIIIMTSAMAHQVGSRYLEMLRRETESNMKPI